MFDVAVLGGGPAGLAVAIALARRGRSVVVLEREERVTAKAGETFGPRVQGLLSKLGAASDFARLPFRGVRSAWGSPELADRPSIQNPLGEGWHVDRARFEATLQSVAEQAGVEVRRGAGACVAARDGDGFRVLDVRARYVVDASGRGAGATAQLAPDRAWLSFDRQIALVQRTPAAAMEPELLLESCEEGWWYAAPQPDGTMLTALLTDGDLAGPREERGRWWAEALARTLHVRRLVNGESGSLSVVRADTGFLHPHCGPGWRAVGDAAMGSDPLAGDGVERALRSALDAADAIERELDGAPFEPPAPPTSRIESYLSTRARYYALETRWPRALYWQRRQPIDLGRAAIWLSPVERLRRSSRDPADSALAPAEALVPRRAVAAALALPGSEEAHLFLSALRQAAPLEDRRLLAALQLLVESGLLEGA